MSLYNGNKYVRMVKADRDSLFTMDMYGDFSYQLEAKALGEKMTQSEKVKVPSALKPAPLLLKLKPLPATKRAKNVRLYQPFSPA